MLAKLPFDLVYTFCSSGLHSEVLRLNNREYQSIFSNLIVSLGYEVILHLCVMQGGFAVAVKSFAQANFIRCREKVASLDGAQLNIYFCSELLMAFPEKMDIFPSWIRVYECECFVNFLLAGCECNLLRWSDM